jgi:LPS export ABC transporter protein LptC
MTKWQRRARLLVAVFAVGFAVLLMFAFKRRAPAALSVTTGRTDPNAVVESTSGQSFKFNRAREDVRIEYDRQLTYKDGSTRLIGVKVITTERSGERTFTVSAKEGLVGQNESIITMNGDVHFTASDGLTAKTEHATYGESDGMVRAPGPVEFARPRLSGTGIGMTYDKGLDVLVILDQAHIQMPAGEGGTTPALGCCWTNSVHGSSTPSRPWFNRPSSRHGRSVSITRSVDDSLHSLGSTGGSMTSRPTILRDCGPPSARRVAWSESPTRFD